MVSSQRASRLTEHKICSIVEWAARNNYRYKQYAWPDHSERRYNPYFSASPLNAYVRSMDNFHFKEGLVVVEAEDALVLQVVWPNGARRYELLGRDGTILCDPFSRFWYRSLQNLIYYGRLHSHDLIELDLGQFQESFYLNTHHSFLIGDVNHGHWLFDHYAKAIYMARLGTPSPLIRPLDSFKYDSLLSIGLSPSILPDSLGRSASIRCRSLTVLSNPPPQIIPYTIKSVLRPRDRNTTRVLYLDKNIGNVRLLYREELILRLKSIGVETVDPVTFSYTEFCDLISTARGIIAPMGAEIQNCLFFGTPSAILFPENYRTVDNQMINWLLASCSVNPITPVYCPLEQNESDLSSPDDVKFNWDEKTLEFLDKFIQHLKRPS